MDAMPIKFACIHQCTEKTLLSELWNAVVALTIKGSLRIQVHLDDPWEARYKLMSFGIPVDSKCGHHLIDSFAFCAISQQFMPVLLVLKLYLSLTLAISR